MRRSGLTILEVLVGMTSVGLLACLLLPALQSAQEDAKRAECVSNLHNFGIAFHNYHDVNGFLPAGEGGHANGLFTHCQPYLEMQHIAAQLTLDCPSWLNPDGELDLDDAWWTTEKRWELCRTQFGIFVCPSADMNGLRKATKNVGMLQYAMTEDGSAEQTLKYLDTTGNGTSAGFCTYAGSAGVCGYTGFDEEGPFGAEGQGLFTAERRVVFSQVLDGTSNTLAIGEYLGNFDAEKEAWTVSGTWAGAQNMWTAKPLAESAEKAQWSQFSGPHKDVTIFVLGDASVRPVRNNIELKTLRALSGIRDGVAVDIRRQ